jgi:hypothetical protein
LCTKLAASPIREVEARDDSIIAERSYVVKRSAHLMMRLMIPTTRRFSIFSSPFGTVGCALRGEVSSVSSHLYSLSCLFSSPSCSLARQTINGRKENMIDRSLKRRLNLYTPSNERRAFHRTTHPHPPPHTAHKQRASSTSHSMTTGLPCVSRPHVFMSRREIYCRNGSSVTLMISSTSTSVSVTSSEPPSFQLG